MTPSQIAERAAARVERGWCQGAMALTAPSAEWTKGEYVDRFSPLAARFCPLGAIYNECGIGVMAGDGTPEQIGVAMAVRSEVSEIVGKELLDWNDSPGRTQAEVIAVLRQAAQNLKERGL